MLSAKVLHIHATHGRNVFLELDAELHRLSLINGGWTSRPVFDMGRSRTAIVLVGRRRERPFAYVPKETADRIFWNANRTHTMNFSGFASFPNLEYVLDREQYVEVTYCGEPAGVVLYADILLERLKRLSS